MDPVIVETPGSRLEGGFRGGIEVPPDLERNPRVPWRRWLELRQVPAGRAMAGGSVPAGSRACCPGGRAGPWRAPAAHAEAERDRWAQRKAAHLASLEARKQRRLAAAGKKAL